MQSSKDRIVTQVGDWIGVYHGGPYIDIHHVLRPDRAVACINVWDYETGEAEIRFERNAVRARIAEWLEYDEEDGQEPWREADDIIEHHLPYI